MSLKRNMVFGIVGLLIPIFVLLYAVVYITLEKNMYHNAADSLEKLSVEAQIYTMNYLEKEAEVDTLGPNSLLIGAVFSKAYGCPCADDWEEWRCCCRYTKRSIASP